MRNCVLLLILYFSVPVCAANINVTFIVPDSKGPLFWQLVSHVGESAARSLEVDFEVIYSDSHRFASKAVVDEIISREHKPDYLIFFPFLGNTAAVFQELESAKIPFITLEQTFTGDIKAKIGNPREKYKYWLGQVNYDNKAGGELLLDAMIKAHFKKSPEQPMYISGVGGDFDGVSIDRQSALSKRLNKTSIHNVIVNQIFPMYWDPTIIHQRFPLMVTRYPNTNAYWCAGDQMALEILKEHNAISNSPAIIGGFDWLPMALQKVKTGDIAASVGGHFLMVANALVKIVDYDNGVDRFLLPPLLNQYELITIDNVAQHLTFLEDELWKKVNFSNYLVSTNNNTQKQLTVENLLAEVF
ncbi:ABC transporter substrate-binding protein [Colwelliaceae bacterium 6471]